MSGGVWAIVPVKPFGHAKSRLAAVLSPEARAGLSREFFAHALGVLAAVPEVERVIVISQDAAALQLAREQGALALAEDGAPDLNRALARATEAAVAGGAAAILILPTDLPLMSVEDVRDLIGVEADGPAVTLAPDQH